MKKQLTLADVAGYLPYDLIVVTDSSQKTLKIVGYRSHPSTNFELWLCYTNGRGDFTKQLSNCKPVLRPMTDLTKPMIHPNINNGAEFVPLIEVSKIINPYSGQYDLGKWFVDQWNVEKNKYPVNGYFEGEHNLSVRAFDECAYEYFFERNNIIFNLDREGYCKNIMMPIIMCFLQKLHFDYSNLIGQNLAIDINTLK